MVAGSIAGVRRWTRGLHVGANYANLHANCHCSVVLAASAPFGLPVLEESSCLEPCALGTPLSQPGASAVSLCVFAQGLCNMQVGRRIADTHRASHAYTTPVAKLMVQPVVAHAQLHIQCHGPVGDACAQFATPLCDISCKSERSRWNTSDTLYIIIIIIIIIALTAAIVISSSRIFYAL